MMFVGEYLKQARTKSKIKLNSVAKELNISIGYLQAIENDDWDSTKNFYKEITVGLKKNPE